MPDNSSPPIGLLAAWGRFPILVAEALRESGHRVCCLGVRHHADPALRSICHEFRWLGAARLGAAIRWYRRRGVQQATMAGKFHKVQLYQPWFWWHFAPDWTTFRTFWPHFVSRTRDCKDDTLLGAVTDAFGRAGIEFRPATDYAPSLLVSPGNVTGRAPSPAEELDIAFGWELAKEMGRLDVGQSVCVKERAVLAVEAIEGTDLCIRRAGQLCAQGGFIVVKVAKPQQDMRFDVPTVGLGTLETMVAAGARVLAIEGGSTIVLDDAEFRQFAERHRLTVVALPQQVAAHAA
jgi:DUF1009 family protein